MGTEGVSDHDGVLVTVLRYYVMDGEAGAAVLGLHLVPSTLCDGLLLWLW